MAERAEIEAWIGTMLAGRASHAAPAGVATDAILATAEEEGVTALLFERLRGGTTTLPAGLDAPLARAARAAVMLALDRERRCRAVLARLDGAGLRALLLKGSALAYWAYPQPYLRECADIDLLLPSLADTERAADALQTLGYACPMRHLPGDLVGFELTCVNHDGHEIDLHWHLSSTPLFAYRFDWGELIADAAPLPNLSPHAYGLAAVPAFLHACMHRTQNLALGVGDRLKWLYDLVVLGQRFTAADWQALQDQAIQRGLAGVCAAALDAATARFGALAPPAVSTALHEAARSEWLKLDKLPRWSYFQYATWRAFPRAGMRWRWLRQRLVPDHAYLLDRYGARGGWPGLLWRRMLAGIRRLRGV